MSYGLRTPLLSINSLMSNVLYFSDCVSVWRAENYSVVSRIAQTQHSQREVRRLEGRGGRREGVGKEGWENFHERSTIIDPSESVEFLLSVTTFKKYFTFSWEGMHILSPLWTNWLVGMTTHWSEYGKKNKNEHFHKLGMLCIVVSFSTIWNSEITSYTVLSPISAPCACEITRQWSTGLEQVLSFPTLVSDWKSDYFW